MQDGCGQISKLYNQVFELCSAFSEICLTSADGGQLESRELQYYRLKGITTEDDPLPFC